MLVYFGKQVCPEILFSAGTQKETIYCTSTMWSTDLKTWTNYTFLDEGDVAFNHFIKFNGKYFGFMYDRIMVSSDLKTWENTQMFKNIPEDTYYSVSTDCAPVIFNNNVYITMRIMGLESVESGLFKSNDGETWEKVDIDGQDTIQYLCVANDKLYIIGGYIKYSTDGTNWTQISEWYSLDFSYVYYINNMYFGLGNENYYSTDGINWTPMNINTDPNSLNIMHDGKYFITKTSQNTGSDNVIAYSSNGIDWDYYTLPTDDSVTCIGTHNGVTVVSTKNNLFTTTSEKVGTEWQETYTWNLEGVQYPGWPLFINHDGKQFITAHDVGQVISSPDGYNWEEQANSLSLGYMGSLFIENI